MWTLEYNGIEKALKDWGADDVVFEFASQTLETADLRFKGRRYDAAIPFPYGAKVIIRQERELDDDVWGGGSIKFQGTVRNPSMSGAPRTHSHGNTICGPWFYIQERDFQQTYEIWNGWTIPDDPTSEPVFLTKTHSRVFLNYTTDTVTYPTGRLTTGQQITEVLNWVLKPFVDADVAAPFQIGTVDVNITPPIDEVKILSAAQAIQKQMRWTPGAVQWFDHTTVPPTFHCRDWHNLAELNLDLAQLNPTKAEIAPRYDRQRSFVRIQYEQVNEQNGFSWLATAEDIYPALPEDPEAMFRGLTLQVDLRGASIRQTVAELQCVPVDLDSLSWWLDYHEKANGDAYDDGRIEEIELIGDPVITPPVGEEDLGYPREVLEGTPAGWMTVSGNPLVTQRLRVTQKVRIKYANGGEIADKTFSANLNTTNGVTDTYTSTAVDSVAEPVPAGLAQALHTRLSPLPWEGALEFKEKKLIAGPALGKRLNLLNKNPDWTTMRATIQKVRESARGGQTNISFGWPEYLSAGELVDLLRVARSIDRRNPLSLRSGYADSGTTVGLGRSTPSKSESNAGGNWKTLAATENADGTGGKCVLDSVRALGKNVRLHEIRYTDETGAIKYSVIPIADGYGAQAGGESPIVFAGGSGNATKWCEIQAVKQDHYEVKEWNMLTGELTGATFNVAKIPELRGSRTSAIISGVEHTFSDYTATSYIERKDTAGSDYEYQDTTPPYEDKDVLGVITSLMGSKILAMNVTNTGVVVSSAQVAWIDLNIAGRAWSRKNVQP
jgi:hypothetical protein